MLTILSSLNLAKVYAFPFYDLCPKELTLRSEFITYFRSSSLERKNNIKVATRSLNKTFVDVNGEFSFNKTVGPRTESRGYKNSKIIVLDSVFIKSDKKPILIYKNSPISVSGINNNIAIGDECILFNSFSYSSLDCFKIALKLLTKMFKKIIKNF